jgi:hypothetical protein
MTGSDRRAIPFGVRGVPLLLSLQRAVNFIVSREIIHDATLAGGIAVEVLENIGTEEAKKVLQKVANGHRDGVGGERSWRLSLEG